MLLYVATYTLLIIIMYMHNLCTYSIILCEFVLEVIIKAQDNSVVMIKWEIL